MATLVVGGIGAMIGASVGGYAMIGFQAGVIAGGIIDAVFDPFGLRTKPQNQYVGKITTEIISSSTYGQTIPELFGRHRIIGNLIWAKDLLETTSEESADSGGMSAGQAQSIYSYSYYGNFAYGFCSGADIEKIWLDGKLCWVKNNSNNPEVLLYPVQITYYREYGSDTAQLLFVPGAVDLSGLIIGEIILVAGFNAPINGYYAIESLVISDDPEVADIINVFAWSGYDAIAITYFGGVTTLRNTNTNPVDWPGGCVDFERYFTIYDGSYTQDPDPYIQAFEGAANVPAFRGLTYINFHLLPLANFGNHIPSVTVLASRAKTVEEAIQALCARVGLTTDYIDTTGLTNGTDEVTGFKIDSPITARGALEQLGLVYRFDMVESEGKIKFVSFKNTPDYDIPEADLGAGIDEKTSKLSETRLQPFELPRQINLNYFDPSTTMNYENATIIARREVSKSSHILDINTGHVLDQSFAGKLAEAEMRRYWIERDSFEFSLPLKYLFLEPSDIVSLPADFGDREVKITKINLSPQGLLVLSGRKNFQETIPDSPVAPDPGGWDPTIPSGTVYPASWFPLDLPLLFNTDDENGFYGLSFFPPSDKQVGVYRSFDDDSYSLIGKISKGSVIGKIVSGQLIASVSPNIWDMASEITVELSYDGHELSSKTESQVYEGQNSCLIGNEICQFANAVQQSDGRYVLSKFLRGRKGTERYMTGQTINDRFYLLSPERYYRFAQDFSLINTGLYYKCLGVDESSLSTKPKMIFTNTGMAWKCYSPAHLKSASQQNGDYLFSWYRRARKNAGWNNLEEVPLDESIEKYEIDIIDDSDSVEVILAIKTVTGTTNYTYTVASQIADFGYQPTDFKIVVYQIGDRIGRGIGAELLIRS